MVKNSGNPKDVLFVVVNPAAILLFMLYVCFMLLTNMNFQGGAKLTWERIGTA